MPLTIYSNLKPPEKPGGFFMPFLTAIRWLLIKFAPEMYSKFNKKPALAVSEYESSCCRRYRNGR